MADEREVRNLVARYADAIASRDLDAWVATWAEQCEWSVLGTSRSGRAGVLERLEELLGGLDFVVQIASGGIVELEGDRGRGRWTVTEHGRFASGDPLFTLGVYDDQYIREDGRWCFSKRVFHAIYIGPPDMSAKATRPPAGFRDNRSG